MRVSLRRCTIYAILLTGAHSLSAISTPGMQHPPQGLKSAEPFSTVTRAEVDASRRSLEEAISHGAYRPPPPPSPLGRLWQRMLAWLGERLGRLAVHTHGARQPAWLLLALAFAAALIAPLLWRFRRERRSRHGAFLPGATAQKPPLQAWQHLNTEAHALAQEGRWREAIHRLFWAVVARGEALGRWRGDRTRTPREYLPLLTAGSAGQETLAALLRVFERVWYGGESAAEPEFREASVLADKLCTPGTL